MSRYSQDRETGHTDPNLYGTIAGGIILGKYTENSEERAYNKISTIAEARILLLNYNELRLLTARQERAHSGNAASVQGTEPSTTHTKWQHIGMRYPAQQRTA